jgi:hypothetical protein
MSTRSLQNTSCEDSGPVQDQLHRVDALVAIECNCLNPCDAEDGTVWWDTAIASNDLGADQVASGIAYLERAGELVRHPKRPLWVRFRQTAAHDEVL